MKRLILILMLHCSPQLWAVAYNSCANISSGNWNVPASWALSATPTVCNLVVVPGASDTATITTGFSMTVSDAEAASTLATSGSGSLEIQAGGTLTVTTTVTLAGTGTLLIDGGGTGNVGTILTIGAGTTVHVTGASAVLWVQTGASTTTVDLVMTGSSATNATLTIDTGGHLYLAGKWTIMKSTVTNLYGANPVTFCPKQAASSTICNTTGTATALTGTHGGTAATNIAVVNLCPTSSCNTWTTAITQTLAGPTELGTCSAGAKIDQIPAASATSGSMLISFGGSALWPNLTINCGQLSGVGSTTVQSLTESFATSYASGQTTTIQGLDVINSGALNLTKVFPAAGGLVVDGLTISDGVDSGHKYGTVENAVAITGDKIQRLAAYNDTMTAGTFYLDFAGKQCGSLVSLGATKNIPCAWFYNVQGSSSPTPSQGINQIVQNVVNVDDLGIPCWIMTRNGNMTMQGLVAVYVGGNFHCWESTITGSDGASTANLWQWVYGDGNNFHVIDTGNVIIDAGVSTQENILCINAAGECSSENALASGSIGSTFYNFTAYQANAITLSSGNAADEKKYLVNLRDNLFVNPWYAAGATDAAGVTVQADPNWLRQVQAASLDYNVFWQQVCSSDPGAVACAGYVPITNQILGITSYLFPPLGGGATLSKTTSSVTSPCTAGCTVQWSGAITTMEVGDYICRHTGTYYPCDTISVVNSTTSVSLTHGLSGLVTSNPVDVLWGYIDSTNVGIAANGQYSVSANFGTHDQHLNPQFRNPTDTTCKWLVSAGLIADLCAHTDAQAITSATTTVLTVPVDTTGWGIVNNTTRIAIWTNAPGLRCYATITGETSSTVTFTPACTTPTSTDHWGIIDVTYQWGQQIAMMNGWTGAGVPNNPFNAAYDPTLLMERLNWDFTRMNGSLKNPASPSDCTRLVTAIGSCDPGFVAVYPAAII